MQLASRDFLWIRTLLYTMRDCNLDLGIVAQPAINPLCPSAPRS